MLLFQTGHQGRGVADPSRYPHSTPALKTLLTFLFGFALVFPSIGGATNETATASSEHLVARFYRIEADTFVRRLKESTPPNSTESNQHLLVRFLKENHVELKKPAFVFLDEKRSILQISTTEADQDRIERLLVQKKLLNTK